MSERPRTLPAYMPTVQLLDPQVREMWLATHTTFLAVICALAPTEADKNAVIQRAADFLLQTLAQRTPEERASINSQLLAANADMFEKTLFPTQRG